MTQPRRVSRFSLLAAALILLPGRAATQQQVVPPPILVTSPIVTINNSAGDQTDSHVDKDVVSYTDNGAGGQIRHYKFSTGVDAAIPLGSSLFDALSDVNGDPIAKRQLRRAEYRIDRRNTGICLSSNVAKSGTASRN